MKEINIERSDAEILRIEYLRLDALGTTSIAVHEIDDILSGTVFLVFLKSIAKCFIVLKV